MTAAIITGIVVPILGFAIWYWRRKLTQVETREQILERYENEARRAVAKAGSGDVNTLLDERLRAIGRNTSGQRGVVARDGAESTAKWLPSPKGADAGDSGRPR